MYTDVTTVLHHVVYTSISTALYHCVCWHQCNVESYYVLWCQYSVMSCVCWHQYNVESCCACQHRSVTYVVSTQIEIPSPVNSLLKPADYCKLLLCKELTFVCGAVLLEGRILDSIFAVTRTKLHCKGNLVSVYLITLPIFTFCYVCKNIDIIHTHTHTCAEHGDLVKSNFLPKKGYCWTKNKKCNACFCTNDNQSPESENGANLWNVMSQVCLTHWIASYIYICGRIDCNGKLNDMY